MKKCMLIIVLISIFMLSGCNLNVMSDTQNTKSSYNSVKISSKEYQNTQDLLKEVSPAVVAILATTSSYQSIGSGVCVNDKGYILTNNHVVDGANNIKLYLFDGSTANASLVWRDSSLDLAVLKANTDIPYLEMAEAKDYEVGEEVVAIGTPIALSFKHSATKGMISAINRTIQVENDNKESTLSNLIQHDAPINPGNSGGPLIDMHGRVLGINTVKVTDAEGMGFAIPISLGKAVVSRLSTDGSYNTAYMGIMGYTANLKSIDCCDEGYRIVSVAENSPAYFADLRQDDLITQIDGVSVDNSNDIRLILYKKSSGDNVTVSYTRDGNNYIKTIKLGEHPYCYKCNKLNQQDFNG